MASSDDEYIQIKITKPPTECNGSDGNHQEKVRISTEQEDLESCEMDNSPMLSSGKSQCLTANKYSLIRVETVASKMDQKYPGNG